MVFVLPVTARHTLNARVSGHRVGSLRTTSGTQDKRYLSDRIITVCIGLAICIKAASVFISRYICFEL